MSEPLNEISNAFVQQNFMEKRKKMQIIKNKTAAISIAIFLIISMGASMLLIPSANAHTPPYQIKTTPL